MCFSASASFTAAAGLSLIGYASMQAAKNNNNKSMLAAIPLVFAIQQATEGIVWLSFSHATFAAYQNIAGYVYLLFAFAIWPIWMPIATYLIEPVKKKRLQLYNLIFISIIPAFLLYKRVLLYGPNPTILHCNIMYNIPSQDVHSLYIIGALYMLCTVGPFFISSLPHTSALGIFLALSYLASFWMYYQAQVSVWCFFAAILSGLVLLTLKDFNKKPKK